MNDREHTDVAALGAGVVAVAVTILVDEGPFDLPGLFVSLALTLVIFAYVWPHPRRERLKSAALATVLASVMTPIYGFGLELALSGAKPRYCHFLAWSGDKEPSQVSPLWLSGAWLAAAAVLFVYDRKRNPEVSG